MTKKAIIVALSLFQLPFFPYTIVHLKTYLISMILYFVKPFFRVVPVLLVLCFSTQVFPKSSWTFYMGQIGTGGLYGIETAFIETPLGPIPSTEWGLSLGLSSGESSNLLPLSAHLTIPLLPDQILSPFIVSTLGTSISIPKEEGDWILSPHGNVGAGLEFQLTPHIALALQLNQWMFLVHSQVSQQWEALYYKSIQGNLSFSFMD